MAFSPWNFLFSITKFQCLYNFLFFNHCFSYSWWWGWPLFTKILIFVIMWKGLWVFLWSIVWCLSLKFFIFCLFCFYFINIAYQNLFCIFQWLLWVAFLVGLLSGLIISMIFYRLCYLAVFSLSFVACNLSKFGQFRLFLWCLWWS